MLSRPTTLCAMVEHGASINEIAEHLDGLAGAERVEEVASLHGKLIGRLHDLARSAPALRLEDAVPEGTPSGAAITYEGRNSLPAFTHFQKRLTRTADGLMFGYNASLTEPLTGPGYFAVVEAGEGELLFDYTRPPPFEPAGWPRYVPNERGPARIVFGGMQDYVRRVATGVMVGAAYRGASARNMWFTLTLPG